MGNNSAPRLEISIGAITTDLKKGLADAREELNKFDKDVKGRTLSDSFKTSIEAERKALNDARIEAINFAKDLNGSLSESLNNSKKFTESAKQSTESYKQSLIDARKAVEDQKRATEGQRTATEAQRKATEAERTALAKTRAEQALLTLEKRKSQQGTVALSGSYREAQQRLTALGKSIREARDGFASTSPAIKRQITEYRSLNDQLTAFDKRLGNNFRNVGNYPQLLGALSPQLAGIATGFGAITLAVGGLRNASKTILDFNSGILNVSKTTGISNKELSGLSKEIVDLSQDLKVVGTPQLLEYATAAGQLGVKGSQNIINFSGALAQLETASDIKGQEGATEIARLLTLTDGGVQNVKAFGDEIVNLGNNFAATEREILSNAESIAQNVGQYNIGRQEILAFATATKAVGIEAELVGSTFNRTLAVFESAIRTGSGLKVVTDAIGGSQESLSKRFKEDASGVFVDYVKSLNAVYKSGGSVNEQLENIGIVAVRDQRVIGSLATNGFDVLTQSLDTVKNSTGALQREFDTASGKIVNQVKSIGVSWDNLVLTIENGEGSIGKSIGRTSGFFANLLDSVTDTIKESETAWDNFLLASPIYLIDRALEKGRNQGRSNDPFDPSQFFPFKKADPYNVINNSGRKTVETQKEISKEIVRNKNYWQDQADSIKQSIEALDSSQQGGKRWLELTKQLNSAQSQLKLYSDSPTSSKAIKQQEKDAKDLQKTLDDITKSSLSGYEAKLFDIDKKYAEIRKKVSDPTLLAFAKETEQAEKFRVQLERINDTFKKMKPLGLLPSQITTNTKVTAPNELPGLAKATQRINANVFSNITDEFTKQFQSTFRRGLSNIFNDIVTGITSVSDKTFEIENKYAELRRDASASQIDSLNKMERIEKRINNGITNILGNLGASFSKIGGSVLSSALSTGISSGDFKDLTKMFKGNNKAIGYGSLAGLLGGVVQGATSKRSGLAQGLGGALAGAGTGAAIGSVIPGIGTLIGGIGGAIIGGLSGLFGSSKANKEYELQQLQLAEQRKLVALQERANALVYTSSIIGQQTNAGIVTSVDRNEFGDLVANIKGSDIQLVLDRNKSGRGN